MSDTTPFDPYTEKELYDEMIVKKRELVTSENLRWTAESPTDPGVAALRVAAHLGGLLSEYIAERSKQNYLVYAVDDLPVHACCRQLGYKIRGDLPAQLVVTVESSGSQTIPAGAKLYKDLSDGTELPFELQSELVFTGSESKQAYVLQGETFTSSDSGDNTEFQEVVIDDYPVAYGSVVVMVGGNLWTEVTDFVDSSSESLHYVVEYDYNSQPTVIFGDGEFGKKPGTGAVITVAWRTCRGSVGNLAPGEMRFERSFSNISSVTNEAPAVGELLADISSDVSEIYLVDDGSINSFPDSGVAYVDEDSFTYTGITDNYFTGCSGLDNPHAEGDEVTYSQTYVYGKNRETNRQAKISAIRTNRLKTSALSLMDYQFLAEQVPGVARARAFTNYSIVNIQIIPVDAGIPTDTLLGNVYDYLAPRKGATHTIGVIVPRYVYVDVIAEVSPTNNYNFTDTVKPAVLSEIQDFLHPLTKDDDNIYWINGWGNTVKKNLLEAHIFNLSDGALVGDVEITTFKKSIAESGNDNIILKKNEIAHVGSISVVAKDLWAPLETGEIEGASEKITIPKTYGEIQ